MRYHAWGGACLSWSSPQILKKNWKMNPCGCLRQTLFKNVTKNNPRRTDNISIYQSKTAAWAYKILLTVKPDLLNIPLSLHMLKKERLKNRMPNTVLTLRFELETYENDHVSLLFNCLKRSDWKTGCQTMSLQLRFELETYENDHVSQLFSCLKRRDWKTGCQTMSI